MTRVRRTTWLAAAAGIAAALPGCLNPATTQLPTVASRPNAVERRSLSHFDPFPDEDLGPDTQARPPSFDRSREPQREVREGQLLRGAPAFPTAPGYSTGAYRDSAVVQ